jgi:ABC-type Fe3+-hydroxamate transport system substrate-binding protein
MRVVSCVPSISELAEELLPGCLLGRTRFCIAPKSISKLPRIGGTKDLDLSQIIALKPDLVLSVKEENEKDQIEFLIESGLNVVVFDILTLQDAIEMVRDCGTLLGNPNRAEEIALGMDAIREPSKKSKGTVLYLIWQSPWMCAGPDTFIGSILQESGFEVLSTEGGRYPELKDMDEIRNMAPDYVFLSSEPFPFRQKQYDFFCNNLPDSKVFLVDGTLFSWYGSRTAMLPAYFAKLGLSPQN